MKILLKNKCNQTHYFYYYYYYCSNTSWFNITFSNDCSVVFSSSSESFLLSYFSSSASSYSFSPYLSRSMLLLTTVKSSDSGDFFNFSLIFSVPLCSVSDQNLLLFTLGIPFFPFFELPGILFKTTLGWLMWAKRWSCRSFFVSNFWSHSSQQSRSPGKIVKQFSKTIFFF